MPDNATYNFIVSETDEVIPFGTQEDDTFEFSTDININIVHVPSNYGLITWDGSVLTVS